MFCLQSGLVSTSDGSDGRVGGFGIAKEYDLMEI